ncbi:hybrid sensor histidine kinase/response regulator [Coraliomargarita algicola]|uniref:histidine kinase n=1 Tax=Coraliomargarita algicola TaxID=3092156 RepID=A0ABZ0RG01_9BACT|nr:hybrid sensor histidine kinase/response regulator [Coraliomargarita sp. J2-16]WPJ94443.1 hybrid sensor histidine kinase/response regulator [Coraliomargarita sp. J2-16]
MLPILAAIIPTLLLGLCILFLIIRLKSQTKIIAELEAKLNTAAPKTIHRDSTQEPFPPKKISKPPQPVEPEPVAQPSQPEPAYFDSSDSLLATLSHELKTPLNGIMGIAQVLREENDSSDQLIELEGCAHHMHSVLHTLTNLARIQNENEFLPQYREWVSLRETIEQIREDVAFRANGRQIKIYTQHANNRLRLRGDSDHISTIIKSVVLSSIEAVPMTGLPEEKHSLTISWTIEGSEIELCVTNPLEVMEPEREASVQEILNIAKGTERSRIKIEYLHLAVAKALAGFYKGSVQSEQLPEGGVRSTLRFTMEHMIASPSSAKPIGGLRVQSGKSGLKTLRELPEKLKVLAAEDDRASRNLIVMLLKKMGQEVTAVENGQEAIIALQQDPSFDVLLTDVDMPIMDGVEATMAIRAGLAGDEVKDLPIIAVTAFNVISDRSRFKEAGMEYYLPKPVGLKELRATLLEIVNRKKQKS